MNFVEKIDKILKTNTLGISSPSALEDFIEAGRGSITTPYRNKESPGLRTQKKIIEKLRINQDWWDSGKGEIYLIESKAENGESKDPVKILPMDAWELLQDDNHEFKKEIGRLWALIEDFRQPVKAHKGK